MSPCSEIFGSRSQGFRAANHVSYWHTGVRRLGGSAMALASSRQPAARYRAAMHAGAAHSFARGTSHTLSRPSSLIAISHVQRHNRGCVGIRAAADISKCSCGSKTQCAKGTGPCRCHERGIVIPIGLQPGRLACHCGTGSHGVSASGSP